MHTVISLLRAIAALAVNILLGIVILRGREKGEPLKESCFSSDPVAGKAGKVISR